MGEVTKIAWTDVTWNPVRGCSRVSEGCRNCYAEGIAARFSRPGQPFEGFAEHPAYSYGSPAACHRPARPTWTGRVELIPGKLSEPLHWRKPRRVFVNSMSDLFHEKLENEDIAAVFGIMGAARQHTFQVLTKRPARMLEFLRGEWCPRFGSLREHAFYSAANHVPALRRSGSSAWDREWPLSNVWLGVSVEDQKTADERIPLLLQTPAAIRFVSYEPALGPVDLRAYMGVQWPNRPLNLAAAGLQHRLSWVIVGGESGPKARPFDVAWARSVVNQCRETKTAVFVKQMGANVRDRNDAGFEADLETYADGPMRGRPTEPRAWPSPLDVEHDPVDTNYQGAPVRVRLRDRAGADPAEWPEDLRVRQFPEVSRG